MIDHAPVRRFLRVSAAAEVMNDTPALVAGPVALRDGAHHHRHVRSLQFFVFWRERLSPLRAIGVTTRFWGGGILRDKERTHVCCVPHSVLPATPLKSFSNTNRDMNASGGDQRGSIPSQLQRPWFLTI